MISTVLIFIVTLSSLNSGIKIDPDSLIFVLQEHRLNGWFIQDEIKRSSTDEWNESYPGLAQVYNEFCLDEVLEISFKDNDDQIINAELFRMADSGGAYGLFSVSRKPDGIAAGFGNESYMSDSCVCFWKGDYFVRVHSSASGGTVSEGVSMIASAIDDNIYNEDERPDIIELVPDEIFVTERTRYFRGNAGLNLVLPFGSDDISGFSDGVYCDFGTHQILLFEYESEGSRQKWYEKIDKNLDNNKRFSKIPGEDNYLYFTDKEGNNIVFGSAGKYIIGYMGKDITRQPEIFERIEDALYDI